MRALGRDPGLQTVAIVPGRQRAARLHGRDTAAMYAEAAPNDYIGRIDQPIDLVIVLRLADRRCPPPVKVRANISLATDGKLSPLQKAFNEHHALQCGFCTSGILMNMAEFLKTNPKPSEAEIRAALVGNLCRCTGYAHIVEAVQDAAGRSE